MNGGGIIWRNLQVAVTQKESIGVDLILPSIMFRGMELRWNREEVTVLAKELESELQTV